MTRIIMCGCNGAMGRMITGIVNEAVSYTHLTLPTIA